MASSIGIFSGSIGRKFVMGLTGLFLISFLLVHCGVNACIFVPDHGLTFNTAAHFMGHNLLIRTMEVVLFIGFILHIVQSYILTQQNNKARPIKYVANNGEANSKWYSRSMGILGSIILLFLIVHLSHFWVKSRFTGLPGEDTNGNENLYAVMLTVFQQSWVVILYVLGCISLAYHLLHGFASSFQTLGLNHHRYNPIIKGAGMLFAIVVPFVFATMPVAIFFGWVN